MYRSKHRSSHFLGFKLFLFTLLKSSSDSILHSSLACYMWPRFYEIQVRVKTKIEHGEKVHDFKVKKRKDTCLKGQGLCFNFILANSKCLIKTHLALVTITI